MRALALVLPLAAIACAPPAGRLAILRVPEAPVAGFRQVVLASGLGEVEPPLRDALRARGFHVQRAEDVGAVARADARGAAKAARRRWRLDGAFEVEGRCAAGGFRFASFRVELVDALTERVVLSGGAEHVETEGCPRAAGAAASGAGDEGTLFADVARLVDAVWARAPAPAPERADAGLAFELSSR